MFSQNTDVISCYETLNRLPKIFDSINKNLNQNEKNFRRIDLEIFSHQNQSEVTLEDNIFSEITFNAFSSVGIEKINSKAFDKTAAKITQFYCSKCPLVNQPPNYDIQSVINQMTQLESLSIGLNISEIPSNFIQPIGGQPSKLHFISIEAYQNLTISSDAFKNFNKLEYIHFSHTTFKKIEKDAFQFNEKSNKTLRITFWKCNLTGETLQSGSFDGLQRPLKILLRSDLNYLSEGVFKSVLDNEKSSIDFSPEIYPKIHSKIDCDDCKNYWLIKEKKQNQVLNTHCKENPKATLFDKEIQMKLSKKCK